MDQNSKIIMQGYWTSLVTLIVHVLHLKKVCYASSMTFGQYKQSHPHLLEEWLEIPMTGQVDVSGIQSLCAFPGSRLSHT